MLTIHNITKKFLIRKGGFKRPAQYLTAVDHVSLGLKSGENLSLVGESGCGKTTLARIIMRLMKEDRGEIVFQNQNITGLKSGDLKKIRKDMQMVFQDPYNSLDPRYTVRNIIREAFTLAPKAYPSEKLQEERIAQVLKAVQLKPEIMCRYPHEFSGGERQRIAIARALLLQPKLIILDEAVSSLDVLIQEDIIALLKDIQENYDVTYLFISHNLNVVKKISHQVAVMYKGRVVELGPIDKVMSDPQHPYTVVLLKAAIDYKVVEEDVSNLNFEAQSLQVVGPGHYVLK
ncbi:MAG: ABC transporter ATP-binding protein [Candidatus Omnitrophica bacterium]|nr:ABC transporter ATP-binding protein [Candidatus Omnitrophota bacterium]